MSTTPNDSRAEVIISRDGKTEAQASESLSKVSEVLSGAFWTTSLTPSTGRDPGLSATQEDKSKGVLGTNDLQSMNEFPVFT